MFGFIGCEQIDVVNDRLVGALWFQILVSLSTIAAFDRYARNLLHINFIVAFGYYLCGGIMYTVDIYGENARCSCWNCDRTRGEAHTTAIETYAFFIGQILQAFVVVDKHKRAVTTGTGGPAQR